MRKPSSLKDTGCQKSLILDPEKMGRLKLQKTDPTPGSQHKYPFLNGLLKK